MALRRFMVVGDFTDVDMKAKIRLTKQRIELILKLDSKGYGITGIAKHMKTLAKETDGYKQNIGADPATIRKIITSLTLPPIEEKHTQGSNQGGADYYGFPNEFEDKKKIAHNSSKKH